MNYSIEELNLKLKNKEIKPIDIINDVFEEVEKNKDLNAYISLDKEGAIKKALELEDKEVDNLLFAMPIAIKDNIVIKDGKTTCASKMLENFISPYDATVIEKINDKNMIIIGKTNMDEFAMGMSGRTSYFGPAKNPHNRDKIPGGSSSGSAVAVASNQALLSLGSDTGGSIRQPASYCGIVGMKPTYGRVSRYGLVAFASSLDQIGPMTKTVKDNAILLSAISGRDDKDLTSSSKDSEDFARLIGEDIKEFKIAVPKYYMDSIKDQSIRQQLEKTISLLKKEGVSIDYVDIAQIEHSLTLYQIIGMGEASSNLARFDGVRYGYRAEGKTVEELYEKSRSEAFGDEVKRRIMVGSYLLSGDNAKIYYDKAMMIRHEMTESFKEIFKTYDLIIGPVTSSKAEDLGEMHNDPLASFADDVLVNPANMTGLPAMSVPLVKDESNMPIGLQIIGNYFEEAKMYQLASFIEKVGAENGL